MLVSGQVGLSNGQFRPAQLGKGLPKGPAGARNRKKTLSQIIFNNPRSSIKPESVPDPKNLTLTANLFDKIAQNSLNKF